jgi:hypothetical protein
MRGAGPCGARRRGGGAGQCGAGRLGGHRVASRARRSRPTASHDQLGGDDRVSRPACSVAEFASPCAQGVRMRRRACDGAARARERAWRARAHRSSAVSTSSEKEGCTLRSHGRHAAVRFCGLFARVETHCARKWRAGTDTMSAPCSRRKPLDRRQVVSCTRAQRQGGARLCLGQETMLGRPATGWER